MDVVAYLARIGYQGGRRRRPRDAGRPPAFTPLDGPLLVVGLMVLALIPNAVAKKPFNANWTHRDVFYFGACDGFDIFEGVTIDVRYREYYDNDGNLNSVMF